MNVHRKTFTVSLKLCCCSRHDERRHGGVRINRFRQCNRHENRWIKATLRRQLNQDREHKIHFKNKAVMDYAKGDLKRYT